jgi:hypothetical protein
MAKKRPHILRPVLRRDPETRSVSTGVMAECDRPNDRRAVDDLTAEFVEEFDGETFRRVETGEVVPISDVCRKCLKARSKRAAGKTRPKPAKRAA